jgi:hypothetical protein
MRYEGTLRHGVVGPLCWVVQNVDRVCVGNIGLPVIDMTYTRFWECVQPDLVKQLDINWPYGSVDGIYMPFVRWARFQKRALPLRARLDDWYLGDWTKTGEGRAVVDYVTATCIEICQHVAPQWIDEAQRADRD